MRIEEMFADFKKPGFDLENTMLRNSPYPYACYE